MANRKCQCQNVVTFNMQRSKRKSHAPCIDLYASGVNRVLFEGTQAWILSSAVVNAMCVQMTLKMTQIWRRKTMIITDTLIQDYLCNQFSFRLPTEPPLRSGDQSLRSSGMKCAVTNMGGNAIHMTIGLVWWNSGYHRSRKTNSYRSKNNTSHAGR